MLAQSELVEQLLRLRAVEVTKQAGKALVLEYGGDRISEKELLALIFAELELEVQAYFTEEMEDGFSDYYFEGCGARVGRVSMIEITEA